MVEEVSNINSIVGEDQALVLLTLNDSASVTNRSIQVLVRGHLASAGLRQGNERFQ